MLQKPINYYTGKVSQHKTNYLLTYRKMKRCHFKSEHSTAGVLCTANEALEAIIDDSAEVRSAARAATSHRGPVGKGTGMSGAAPAETGEAGTLNAVPCCPASPTSVPVPPVRALQSRAGGSSAAACPQGHCAALGVWAQSSLLLLTHLTWQHHFCLQMETQHME